MLGDDCTACKAGYRHDHRSDENGPYGCSHARSDGSWRSCCCDDTAATIEILMADYEARRGQGPADARAVTRDVRCLCAETAAQPDPQRDLSEVDTAEFPCATGASAACRAWSRERIELELLIERIAAGLVTVPDSPAELTLPGRRGE